MNRRRFAVSYRLETFFTAYAVRLGRKLEEVLRDVLEPGETMPDLVLLLRLLGRHLALLRGRLEAAERRQRDAATDLQLVRGRRDAAAQTLRRLFADLRRLVSGAHRREGLADRGLLFPSPRRAFDLWQQGRDLVARLGRPDFEMPPPVFPGQGTSPIRLLERLRPAVRGLGKAVLASLAALRRVEAARYRQGEARKTLEHRYAWLGRLTQALCHLLDEPYLASRTHRAVRHLDRRRGAG